MIESFVVLKDAAVHLTWKKNYTTENSDFEWSIWQEMETPLQTLYVGAEQKNELNFSVELEFDKIMYDTRDEWNSSKSRCF